MIFLPSSHSSHLRRCHRHRFLQLRTLYDAVSSLKWPRDRGLDHAVERDKLLKPLINLKNLIISEPSKSIPLALITESKGTLGIPFRPIEFLRKYPSVFQEFQPGSLNIQPHIKLTPEIISLSSEEDLLYQSVNYKQDIASRLLKVLMICRVNKIPIFLLERLKWELGLPLDYDQALIPEFPDYFRVISGKNLGENPKELELVCWGDEFAVSEMEKKGAKGGKIEFSLQFSKEFEMDKKYKKWLDEWQKLPYVSPYENAMHLGSKTDESDKWVVAVLHELLNLFVGKKAERENLLCLGECLGLRARFKHALLQHPGIFYVSSKIGTHTVVLRDAYKRGMLIERHPLMDMRSKYIKLMNAVKNEEKPKTAQKKSGIDVKKSEGGEVEDVEGREEDSDEMYDLSDDDESDDESEDESDDYGDAVEVENVDRQQMKGRDFEGRNTRNVGRRTKGRGTEENVSSSLTRSSRRTNVRGGDSNTHREASEIENVNRSRRPQIEGRDFEGRNSRSVGRRTNGRGTEENVSSSSTRSSRRTNTRGGDSNTHRVASEIENVTRSRRPQIEGRDFEGRNSRSVGRRTYGRGTEENVSSSSTRSPRRTNSRGGYSNTHRDSFEVENVTKRGRPQINGRDFEGRSTRSEGRRTNGRGTEENVSRSSTRFSRRTNVRGGDSNTPRRFTKN